MVVRVPVFVDLALELGQRALGCFGAVRGLLQVPALAGQGIDSGVHPGPELAGRKRLDVAARAAWTTSHGLRVRH
jgi:hypothetical protein